MKNKKWIILGVIAAILVAGIAIAAILGGRGDPQPTNPTNPTTEGTQPSQGTKPSEPTAPPTEPTVPPTEPPTVPPTEPPTEPPTTPPTEPHIHSYTSEVIDPACESGGYTRHTCSCGESYVDSQTPALGHEFGEWVTVKEATTEAEGRKEHTCIRCNAVEGEAIPKLEPHVHSYTSEVIAPTCEDGGYTLYTCACGNSYQAGKTKALGHSYGKWSVAKAATCTKDGKEERKCERCDSSESRTLKKTGHNWSIEETIQATQDKDGYKLYRCSNCKETKKETLPKLNYDFGDITHENISETLTYEVYSTWSAQKRVAFMEMFDGWYADGYITPEEYWIYTRETSHNIKGYECGWEGHTCCNDADHADVVAASEKTCKHCGKQMKDCPSFWNYDTGGRRRTDDTKCPMYDIYKDPDVFCEVCGLPCIKKGYDPTKCCRQWLGDVNCPTCNEPVKKWACHTCKPENIKDYDPANYTDPYEKLGLEPRNP